MGKNPKYWSTATCVICKVQFHIRKPHLARIKKPCCSIECAKTVNLGRKVVFTKAHKLKLSISATNRIGLRGEKSPFWKGEAAGYASKHSWVRKWWGPPTHCEHCGTKDAYFDWANISGKYERIRSDWKMLCRRCHMRFDRPLRTKVFYEYQGRKQSLPEWSEEMNIDYHVLWRRMNMKGMSFADALEYKNG